MRYRLGAAFAVAFVASATPALANVEVGLLECRGASQQFIVGSVTTLQCLFRPSDGGRPQTYDAQIRRVGVDIGFNQSTVLAVVGVRAEQLRAQARSAAPMSARQPTPRLASASAPTCCGAVPTTPSRCSR